MENVILYIYILTITIRMTSSRLEHWHLTFLMTIFSCTYWTRPTFLTYQRVSNQLTRALELWTNSWQQDEDVIHVPALLSHYICRYGHTVTLLLLLLLYKSLDVVNLVCSSAELCALALVSLSLLQVTLYFVLQCCQTLFIYVINIIFKKWHGSAAISSFLNPKNLVKVKEMSMLISWMRKHSAYLDCYQEMRYRTWRYGDTISKPTHRLPVLFHISWFLLFNFWYGLVTIIF